MESLKEKAHTASKDGMAITLFAMLCSRDIDDIHEALAAHTDFGNESTTPLVIACKNGHDSVVNIIICHYDINIEQTGTVQFDGYTIEEASPLWVAAAAGHLEIVKTLVEAGADVNHTTKTNSSPLRAACFDGSLDIVKYLMEHQADFTIANKYKNTCIMIACYKGHLDVLHYLLEAGADPNCVAHCGATALHFSAESGKVDIIKELLSYGTTMVKNDHQMSPLMVAAEANRAEVVQFLISRPEISKLEAIEALELLGASYANDKDQYDIEKVYHYFWLAMQMRYRNQQNILKKQVLDPMECYNNNKEAETIEQLEELSKNPERIHFEALMVRERILGRTNPEIPHPIIFRGAVYADMGQYDKCIALWSHAMKLKFSSGRQITKDLQRFAQIFSQMLHVGVEVQFQDLYTVFRASLDELEKLQSQILSLQNNVTDDEKIQNLMCVTLDQDDLQESMDLCLNTTVNFLILFTKLKLTQEQQQCFGELLYRFNRLDISLKNGYTPLHIASDHATVVDDFHVNDVVQYPNSKAVSLLLKCGANPNAVTKDLQTPLHLIVLYNRPISDFLTLHSIMVNLVAAGSHVDRVDINGKTASDISTTGVADIIIRTQDKMSLKCLAARAIRKNNIKYAGIVPITLEDFIEMH